MKEYKMINDKQKNGFDYSWFLRRMQLIIIAVILL